MSSKNHDILNFLIQKFDLKTYLEIGVRAYKTFDNVVCDHKVAVDPAPQGERSGGGIVLHKKTSNDFFNEIKDSNTKFDLIFIDGDHSYEAVRDDLESATKFVSPKGFIVLHDIDPPAEKWQGKPKLVGGPGTRNLAAPLGECWKAMVERRIVNQDIKVFTVKCDENELHVPQNEQSPGSGCETGLAVCKFVESNKDLQEFVGLEINWDLLNKNRQVLLNRHTMEEFYEKVESFFKI